MIVYKVFSKDYEHEKINAAGDAGGEKGDLRGKTPSGSGSDLGQVDVRGLNQRQGIYLCRAERVRGRACDQSCS